MRQIDADKLVDAMTGACNILDAQGANTTLARTLITIAAKAPTIGDWISVEDRLPEKNGEYIVFDEEDVYSAMYKRGRKKSEWTDFEEQCLNLDITHWMPLPEPPES